MRFRHKYSYGLSKFFHLDLWLNWRLFELMKIQKSIHINSIRRLFLMVSAICLLAFTGCSHLADKTGTRSTVNYHAAAAGESQTGDNVTIGPTTYNSETQSFETPWPFGPELNPQ